MTEKGVLKLIGRIAATNGTTLERDTLEAQRSEWLKLLASLSDEAGDAALTEALSEKKYPAPSDILRLAGGRRPSVEARAELAWEDVLEMTGAFGAYRSPIFEDPLSSRVVREMGGWAALCSSDQERHWLRREFIEIYSRIAEATAGKEVKALPTAGIFERGQLPERGGDLERVVPAIEQGDDEQAHEIAAENAWQDR